MLLPILVNLIVFGTLFGIFYLFFTTRNKERLALIEKGADAEIFYSKKTSKKLPLWKVVLLNKGFFLFFIGLGIFIANLFESTLGMEPEVVYPASIFLFGGLGMIAGFFVSRKVFKEEEEKA